MEVESSGMFRVPSSYAELGQPGDDRGRLGRKGGRVEWVG